jgi:integrase
VVGTVDQFPTKDLAQAALNGLRMCINEDRNRQREQSIRVADLVDHYVQTELSEDADWHSHATRIVYRQFLKRWIRPHWADVNIREVRTVRVERWLRQLRRANGDQLADTTKAKIRNLMSVLFNHAIRYEWLEQVARPTTPRATAMSMSRVLKSFCWMEFMVQSYSGETNGVARKLGLSFGTNQRRFYVDFWS